MPASRNVDVHDRSPERSSRRCGIARGPGGRECNWIPGPLGQTPWNGPLPGGRADWRDDHRYCRKNEKKLGAPTRGHEANVSMMNSPGPGWAYMPRKTISPWETRVSPPSPPSGTGPNV